MLQEIYRHEQLEKAARQHARTTHQPLPGLLRQARSSQRLARLIGQSLLAIGARLVAYDAERSQGGLCETQLYVTTTAFSQN